MPYLVGAKVFYSQNDYLMKKSIVLLLCCFSTAFFLSAQSSAHLFLQQKDTVSAGGQLCVQVFATNFSQLDSLQLSVRYSANALQWQAASQPVGAPDGIEINAQKPYDGLLQITWKNTGNPAGITISDTTVLLELCFEATRPTVGNEYVALVNAPLPVRAFDINQQAISIVATNLDWLEPVHIFPMEEVYLALEDTVVAPGQPFCRKLRLLHADKPFISMQFSLGWNPALLRLDSVIHLNLSGLRLDRDFNLNIISQGKFSCLWQDEQVRGVTEDSVEYLYEVCFTALDTTSSTTIQFTPNPTAIEFISADFELLRFQHTPASIVIDADPFMRPGDTNDDGMVDHFDLLNIGLGYGNIGANRRNADLDWNKQPVADWEQTSPLSNTNYKHFDTDGNGIIDLTDAQAININWHQTAEDGFTDNDRTEIREEGAPLYVQTKTIFPMAQSVTFDIILGEEAQSADNLYGIAFSVEYDEQLGANDVYASFDTSWLGKMDEDLLVFQKNNLDENRLDIALVRIDGQNRSGFGTLGQLHFTAPAFTGETEMDTVGALAFQIQNVRAIDFDKMEQLTTPMETTAVLDVSTGINDPAIAQKIRVFPNPAQDVLYIRASDLHIEKVVLYNINGKQMIQYHNTPILPLESLQAGLYFCKIWTDKGLATKKIAIAR